ncbi:hypothetical protein [Lysobacter capsici]|uniref:hypothetical protein n=1 Tax=Lysobacter capsici TaxID=435897 RepID=UPI001C0064C5|nr:hypothetical protein [Lysobacter capsici]QWF19044.1 hypothetical protein KME82_10060 [Lysobacter capsici]
MVGISRMLISLLALATLFVSTSASAQRLQVWNGSAWVNNGVVNYTGPVIVKHLGNSVPCTANWTLTISGGFGKSGGVGSITNMAESGSATCTGSAPQNLPWPTTESAYSGPNPPISNAPTLTLPIHAIRISGVRVYVPAPLNVHCPSSTGSGTIDGFMEDGGAIVFYAILGPCIFQTRPGFRLIPNMPVRVTWI